MPKAGDTSFSPAGTSPASFTIDSHFFPGGVLAWRSRGCPGPVMLVLETPHRHAWTGWLWKVFRNSFNHSLAFVICIVSVDDDGRLRGWL